LELIELKTNIRTTTGNGPARRLRQKGQIPAVLYGPGTESVLLSVNITDIEMVLKKGRIGQALLNLVISVRQRVSRLGAYCRLSDANWKFSVFPWMFRSLLRSILRILMLEIRSVWAILPGKVKLSFWMMKILR